MPAPRSERISKARLACAETAAVLRKHPEFWQQEGEHPSVDRNNTHTTVALELQFTKSGRKIFRNPPGMEDHDWPDLVGKKILERAARQGAGKAGLKLTKNVRIITNPGEKGWVEVGYQFLHQAAPQASPPGRPPGRPGLARVSKRR